MVIRRSRSTWTNGIKEGSDRDFVDDELLPFAKPPKDLANLQPLEAVELLPPVLRGDNHVVLTVPAGVR